MAVNTYYFDASDGGPTDTGTLWTNDANVFDSDGEPPTTYASASSSGSETNSLHAEGTNAPATGGNITQVRMRFYADYNVSTIGTITVRAYTNGLAETLGTQTHNSNNTPQYTSYVTLSTPSGGWSWSVLQALEVKIWLSVGTDGTALVARVELEVTSEVVGVSQRFYLVQGF